MFTAATKGGIAKSKEELTLEKRRELERRLQDVSGQLNSVKKPTKPKGELSRPMLSRHQNGIPVVVCLQEDVFSSSVVLEIGQMLLYKFLIQFYL